MGHDSLLGRVILGTTPGEIAKRAGAFRVGAAGALSEARRLDGETSVGISQQVRSVVTVFDDRVVTEALAARTRAEGVVRVPRL
jgi:hypothetical protein